MIAKMLALIFAFSVSFAFITAADIEIAKDKSLVQETNEEKVIKETTENVASGGLRTGTRCFAPTKASRQHEISRRLRRANENQKQQKLQLALATTKLVELEKQRVAENITDSTPNNQLTHWQRNLLKEIARTKARKEDVTVDSGVTKTLIEQLEIILTANGGSTNSILSNNPTNLENQLNNKIKQAQGSQQKTNDELANVTSKLEQLEKQKNDLNIDTDNGIASLTQAQKGILMQIERTKVKKYELTTQSALTNTLIEQLQLQLNEITSSTSGSSANTANTDSAPTTL